ncbi:hypothetical protein R3P38DRAFT_2879955 [Favolaschia claudopus]|uniref:TPR-like protein n=1 Tax=Favolaschia claudopus TaxID=2862362 RepID=A0AAW0CWY1_9AGAR
MPLSDLLDNETLIAMEDAPLSAEDGEDSSRDSQTSDSDEEEEDSEKGDSEKGDDTTSQEPNVEMEIEGDFDRLINNIRMKEGTSSGLLNKDWDFGSINDQDSQFKDDLRLASGIGKRRKKGQRAIGPTLSFEVRSLLGDGNQAYVDGNLPEAIRIMLEVIRIEPRVSSAWSVLAQCHEDMKQDQQALQLRIMAAHLRHDADEWDRLARQSKDLGYNQQALYCWGKLSHLDPENVNAQWDRALLARDMGDLKTTRNAFLVILKRFPHDLAVLSELRTTLIEIGDLETCTTLFQAAFEHYQKMYPSGHGFNPTTHTDAPGGGFGLLEILVLADLYNTTGDYARAVDVIRQGSRWLQGRAEHRYWDTCDDDREYDVPEFNRTVESGPESGLYPLDLNARHRLTVARIKMGEIEEAKLHASVVLAEDVLDYAPLFAETADAYFEQEMYAEARPIYELLGREASTSSMYVLLQTATCLRMMNELREAAEVYEYMIDSRKRLNRSTDVNMDESEKAKQLPSSSLFSEQNKAKTTKSGRQRMSAEALMELEAKNELDTLKGHRRLEELYPQISKDEVNDSEREWLLQAEKIIDSFRECRQLFSTSQYGFRGVFPARPKRAKISEDDEDRMASRLQLEIEGSVASKAAASTEVFRGLDFPEWLKLFFQYCFLLTWRGQFEVAEEILKHLIYSTAYRSLESQTSIRLAILTCAMLAQRHATIVEQSRKLMSAYQFNNEPLRIYLAVLGGGLHATDAFVLSPVQKYLYRELKSSYIIAKTPDAARWVNQIRRFSIPDSKLEEPADEDDPGGPGEPASEAHPLPQAARKINPVLTALYGQMCISAKSYQSAIFYLLYAYELCSEDPMICLSLAVASMGRALQRQSDNRHHLITQAMGLLTRYRQLRSEQKNALGEVDYNLGRAFQQLGLYSHAVTHYEKVLQMAETEEDKHATLAKEAAYNLSLIYGMTGSASLAGALYRRWLSL